MKEKVLEVINYLRTFLMYDGGNIVFVKIEDNILYVRLQGACIGCPMKEFTLKDGIEKTVLEKVPEIKEVRLVD
mgnify:FL=1